MSRNEMLELLRAEFDGGEVRQFTGRGGKTFDYIEDETVMARLDDVFGLGGWSIAVASEDNDYCIKVRLSVHLDDEWVSYEDYGYPNNDDSREKYKEAVSDGIRRCGRYLGIGRYLYIKHDSPAGQRGTSSPAPRPTAQAVGVSPAPTANEPPWPGETIPIAAECPIHHKPYRNNARGLFCPNKLDDGSWCKEPRRAA